MNSIQHEVERWVRNVVIGLNLCPFAAEPLRNDRVRYAATPAVDFDDAVTFVLDEVERLFEHTTISTTLCIFEAGLDDFDEFLDACATVEALFEDAGASEFVQIAHFHPGYLFDGVDADDPANHTNRAPAPVIQLLRVNEVANAVESHPDAAGIPERNVARMRELGADAVAELGKQE